MTYTIAVCTVKKTFVDGQRKFPKHVEFHSNNKFEKLVHIVGIIIRNVTRCTVIWTSNLYKLYYVFSCMYIFLSPTLYRVFCYSGPTGLSTMHFNGFAVYCLMVTKEQKIKWCGLTEHIVIF